MGSQESTLDWVSAHNHLHAVRKVFIHESVDLNNVDSVYSCPSSALSVSLKFALTNKAAGWAAYAFIILYQLSFGIA